MPPSRLSETRVAVLEYLCGGGLRSIKDPTVSIADLYSEGYGMLARIASDLSACGLETTIVLDHSMHADIPFSSDSKDSPIFSDRIRVIELDSDDWLGVWRSVARSVDIALVIAPEIDHELLRIVEDLRANGCNIHSSSRSFIETTSDKALFANSLPSRVVHPKTWLVRDYLSAHARSEYAAENGNGWVLKDRYGAGCCGMSWYPSRLQLFDAIQSREEVLGAQDRWIVQQWHEGEHASLAILCESSTSFQLLGACSQTILRGEQVTYRGGSGPILNESYAELEDFVKQLLDGITGARGWIGVDFVYPSHRTGPFQKNDLVLVEINPRLTTSYKAYRQWYGPELAMGVIGLPTACDWKDRNMPGLVFTVA